MKLHTAATILILSSALLLSARNARAQPQSLAHVNCETIRTISAADTGLIVAWLRLRYVPTDEPTIDLATIQRDVRELRNFCEKRTDALPIDHALHDLFDLD